MKKCIVGCFALCISIIGRTQGIQFQEKMSWTDIKAKAKKENKYIFMDAYTTWCAPCKWMAEETFPQSSVGDVINANFISVKVQMDKTTNDDQSVKEWYNNAEAIAKESNITAYPTILFYSPDGKLLHKIIGHKDPKALIEEAKNALDPSKQYFTLIEGYKRGKIDTAGLKELAYQALQMGEKTLAINVGQRYISTLSKKDIYTNENLQFIGAFLSGSKDRHFNMFFKESKKINEIVDKHFAENTVMNVIEKEEVAPYTKEKDPDWETIEKRAVSKFGTLGQEVVCKRALVYYWDAKEWKNFSMYYKKYFDLVIPKERSALHINNMSWAIFEHVDDPDVLATAIKAMRYNHEKFGSDDPTALDTYANLLYKTGKRDEAIQLEEKAARLSNNEKVYVETLQKMKANEKTWTQ
jgi:thioredoxin-related protein